MFKVFGIKPKARADFDNHRYIIEPLEYTGGMRIGTALKAIKETTHTTWRFIADYFGLSDQSEAFKLTYCNKPNDPSRDMLKQFLTIEDGVAYMYDKDHKPKNAVASYIPIVKKDKSVGLKVYTNVPTKVTTRITFRDPLARKLTMSITPTNGYIVGITDLNICSPNTTYVVRGTVKTFNNLLRSIYFVGCDYGDASVVVTVRDDSTESSKGVVSATVKLTVLHNEQPSIPELTIPENVNIVLGADSPITGVNVNDKDNKIMELRVSPFGCEVFGFAGLLGTIKQGEIRTIYGKSATINKDIANLVVRTNRADAQIGFELICGKTIIRKYVKFSVGGEVVQNDTADSAIADETKLNS